MEAGDVMLAFALAMGCILFFIVFGWIGLIPAFVVACCIILAVDTP